MIALYIMTGVVCVVGAVDLWASLEHRRTMREIHETLERIADADEEKIH